MGMLHGLGRALRGVRAGFHNIASEAAWLRDAPDSIAVSSPAFGPGRDIPTRFTADGEGLSPPLAWDGAPSGTRSLVLLVEDPDLPFPVPMCHALAFDIPPDRRAMPEGIMPHHARERLAEGFRMGRTTVGPAGWLPPTPPSGHGPHHYVVQVFATDLDTLDFEWPPGRGAVLRAIKGHVLARGTLVGIYERA